MQDISTSSFVVSAILIVTGLLTGFIKITTDSHNLFIQGLGYMAIVAILTILLSLVLESLRSAFNKILNKLYR